MIDELKVLSLAVCPKDLCSLSNKGDHLLSDCQVSYPIINGKPILIDNPRSISLTSPESAQISQNIEEFVCPDFLEGVADAKILHLGSGNVKSNDPRVISTDILPNENVDIVCEGESLPFRDASFDFVTSGAVLEHVSNPIAVASELRRVLKIGGILQSTVAFNQPYHGFPSHYFNWTPVAMETYLLGDFELIKSGVSQDGTLAVTLSQSWDLYLEQLPEIRRKYLLNLTLQDALDLFRFDRSQQNPNLLGIPRFTQEQLSSAYEVMGRKIQNENFPNFKLIQSVYEKRRIILLRLQEIEFYSLRLFEKKGVKSDALVYQIPNILGFMTEEQATMLLLELTEGEAKCTDFRDRVIASYLM